MKFEKLAFQALSVALLLAFALLYAKGHSLKAESFGLGLGYVLSSVVLLGLSIIAGCMALLAPSNQQCAPPAGLLG